MNYVVCGSVNYVHSSMNNHGCGSIYNGNSGIFFWLEMSINYVHSTMMNQGCGSINYVHSTME